MKKVEVVIEGETERVRKQIHKSLKRDPSYFQSSYFTAVMNDENNSCDKRFSELTKQMSLRVGSE